MTKCAFRAFLSVPKEPDNSRECTDREEVRSEFQVAVKRQDSIGAAPGDQAEGVEGAGAEQVG